MYIYIYDYIYVIYEMSRALFTGVEIRRKFATPRNRHFEVRNRCGPRFTQRRACHAICSRFTKRCSSSAQNVAPATGPATEGAQSAAPATKSAVPVHKVPLLPRNLLLEVLKVLCLPRNLHFQWTKCRSCHEICTSRFTSRSVAKAVRSGRRSFLCNDFLFLIPII